MHIEIIAAPETTTDETDETPIALPSLKPAAKPAKARRMARAPKAEVAAKPARAPKPAKEPKAPRTTKAAEVIALLEESAEGVSRETLTSLTGWLPHTLRAFLSGLRKKGIEVIRDTDATGQSTYRIAKAAAA
jgi:Protein of unknown function (DUF3489)